MANELKACPFCGANGEELGIFRDADAWDSPSRRIQCLTCNVEAPFYPSEDEAIAGWNTRANHAQQDAPTDAEWRLLWKANGGSFHGPKVETATMPEEKLLSFLRWLTHAPAQDELDAYLIDRMGKLLAGVAVALKGPEEALQRHGYQDLPELANKIMAELALHRAREQDAPAQDAERERDSERWRFMRLKLCLTGNGDGTCAMHAINLPCAIPGWPETAQQVAEFCEAAIDAARAQRAAEQGDA